MDFNSIAQEPGTLEMVGRILADIGLDDKSLKEFKGAVYDARVTAAVRLKEAIRLRHEAGEGIAAPDDDLVNKAYGAATRVEKDRESVTLTRTIIEMVVIGHVWMAKGDKFAKFGALQRILDVMEKGMTAKRHRSFFDCKCDSGGCGNCGSGGCGGHP